MVQGLDRLKDVWGRTVQQAEQEGKREARAPEPPKDEYLVSLPQESYSVVPTERRVDDSPTWMDDGPGWVRW
jgi:hypothetical protein